MGLIIGALFQVCMGLTFVPEVLLFKQWCFIDIQIYEIGMEGNVVGLVADVRESTIIFCYKDLQESKPRNDYRKFLELAFAFFWCHS